MTAVALAGTGALTYKGCFANRGEGGCKTPKHDSLTYATGTAVSPDGRSVYVVGFSGITTFVRGRSGALSFAGCIGEDILGVGDNGCKLPRHNSLVGSFDVAVSPDGKSVYVASYEYGSITRFDRAPDGTLTYRGCFADRGKGGCQTPRHDSLSFATGLAVSPDGRSVYVASYGGDSVTRFKRGPNGALTYGGCFADGGEQDCKRPHHDSLEEAAGVAVSPDGRSVYVIGEDAVTRFDRRAGGALRYRRCIADGGEAGCRRARHPSIGEGYRVAVSPDGRSVYTTSYSHDAISRFDRGPTGALKYRGCVASEAQSGCRKSKRDSLDDAVGVAVSGDGQSVYVAAIRSEAITRFNRTASGGLDFAGCIASKGKNRCKRASHNSLRGAAGLALSPDDSSVYVASYASNSVTFVGRETAGP